MIDPKKPLREIEFSASGYCVMQHRIKAFNKAFNKDIPLFLKAIKSRQKVEKEAVVETKTTKNVEDNEEGSDMSDLSSSSDSNSESDGEHLTFKINPSSLWTTSPQDAVIPKEAFEDSEDAFIRVENDKKRFFPELPATRAVEVAFERNGNGYPWSATHNSFDILTTGSEEDPIAPDFDMVLYNVDKVPIYSKVQRTEIATAVLATAYTSFEVEEMSLQNLSDFLEDYAGKFLEITDTDSLLAKIQAQPSMLRPFYDTKARSNYNWFAPIILQHAVLRALSGKMLTGDTCVFEERLAAVRPGIEAMNINLQDLLFELTGNNQGQYWLQLNLAEFDLLLQIHAPSIYNDPLKICELTQGPRSVIPYTLWHLWDDATLSDLLKSPLRVKLLQAKLPRGVVKCVNNLLQLQMNAAVEHGNTL